VKRWRLIQLRSVLLICLYEQRRWRTRQDMVPLRNRATEDLEDWTIDPDVPGTQRCMHLDRLERKTTYALRHC
jgi:hypothetical protein